MKCIFPRIKFFTLNTDSSVNFPRVQFPSRLAYAMTINKSQGQTFDKIGIVLTQPVFAHGQLCVALSRVRSRNDVKVLIYSRHDQGFNLRSGTSITRNIVFKEVFSYQLSTEAS